ncbi:MAG: phospholipase D family protein [Alphaproteobacteria bacterium]|nr:phospholipase D family protein [Alphaproteobacteria bacterium]
MALFASRAFADGDLIHRTISALQGNSAEAMPPPAAMELAFSPGGGATDLVIKAIQSAHKTIHVASYSFTSRPIAHALIAAHQAGIDVAIVIDHEEVEQRRHSVAPLLTNAGVPLRVDIVHALLHDKYMIIDGKNVETGSFNYTAGAEEHNAENVLVLWDDPKLASAYEANWQSLWDKAESYGGQ